MSFINQILNCKSISIVGMEKNTGKTECLNFILRRLPQSLKVAVTSVGIDGETQDQVTNTPKPRINLKANTIFSTSEYHYSSKRLPSEIIDITNEGSALGRMVTALTIGNGNVILSGPSSVSSLKRWVKQVEKSGADLTLIDGALSRLSIASASLCEAMILTTGASVTPNAEVLVRKTKFIKELIELPIVEKNEFLENLEKGVWGINEDNNIIDLKIGSSLLLSKLPENFNKSYRKIFISGALTTNFMKQITLLVKEINGFEIIVRDFTRIFAEEQVCRIFFKKGGKISVLGKSKLLAVCINPTSPQGYNLDSDNLCTKMSEALNVPVYDIIKNRDEI